MGDKAKVDLKQLRFTEQYAVDLLYDTLECVHDVLTKNNINYTIFSGTALGAERHGGLIPWDDDADTAILSTDEPRLVALADIFAKQGFILREEPYFGYRLYHATLARPRALDQHPYPFVDIFLIKDTGTHFDYSTEDAMAYWPHSPLPYGCYDRLVDVQFGHLTLRSLSPEDMKQHLDDNYGIDWPNVAWREFDHFYYEGVTDLHLSLKGEKARQPALHSKHQRLTVPLKSVTNIDPCG